MSEIETYEQDMIQMDEWFSSMDRTGKIGNIDDLVLDRTLNYLGAEFEITKDEEKSLKKYSDEGSRPGMDAVWKKERYDEFVQFCNSWISEYESTEGNLKLPKLEKSGRKNAGMKEFFHQLTSYAYGTLSKKEFIRYTQIRIKNGKLWQEGKKDKRERIETPISEGEKKLIGSIPPGFIPDFWKWLKSTSNGTKNPSI